jgi:hypothetical protein
MGVATIPSSLVHLAGVRGLHFGACGAFRVEQHLSASNDPSNKPQSVQPLAKLAEVLRDLTVRPLTSHQ